METAFTIENKMDKHPLVPIGKRIEMLRTKAGLTYGQLSKRADLARGYISLVEQGERNPKPVTLMKFARGFGLTYAELVEGTDAVQDYTPAAKVDEQPDVLDDILDLAAPNTDRKIARMTLEGIHALPHEVQRAIGDLIASLLKNLPPTLHPGDRPPGEQSTGT